MRVTTLVLAALALLLTSPAFAQRNPTTTTTGANFGKNGVPEITVIMAGHDY